MEQDKFAPVDFKSAYDALERLGCKIHWFNNGNFEIPQKSNLSLFPQDDIDNARWAFGVLTRYIKSPAIEDWFENHTQRRKWRATLSPELYEVVKLDRLRGNNTSIVFEAMRLLSELLDEQDPRVSQINAIRNQLELNYPDSSKNTPLDFADLLTGSALDVLNLFSEDYPKEASG